MKNNIWHYVGMFLLLWLLISDVLNSEGMQTKLSVPFIFLYLYIVCLLINIHEYVNILINILI